MKVMVTGGRDYKDYYAVYETIRGLSLEHSGNIIVIHGGARGADTLASRACRSMGLFTARVEALWGKQGKSAGVRRNEAMVRLLKPDLVLAFPGGKGTADAVRRAREAGIEVVECGGCETTESVL